MKQAPRVQIHLRVAGLHRFLCCTKVFSRAWDHVLELEAKRRRRGWLCRIGLHRWGPWTVQHGNFRVIEKKCRRCHAVRVWKMVGHLV